MKKVLPKILPILLIVGTLLALALTSFAGEEGVRLAIVEKANKAVTLDGIKDDVYKDSVALGNAANPSHGTLSVTWDKDNLYFFADIVDPKIKEFVELYGNNWFELVNFEKNKASEAIDHKVNGEGDAKQMMQFVSWVTPSFEIIIDPSNSAQAQATTLWQARVSFDNNKVFFQYSDPTYNSYEDEKSFYPDGNEKKVRFTSETKYDLEKGTYSVEMCVPRKSLGFLNEELTDHQMISINAFYYSIDSLPTAETVAEKTPAVKSNYIEKVTVLGDTYTVPSIGENWNAPKFSFLRLWDPSVTANESDFGTETTKETTTIRKIDGGVIIHKTTKVTTTKKPTAAVTTETPKTSGGCGSVIGAGAAVLASLMIVPTAMLLKKKHED